MSDLEKFQELVKWFNELIWGSEEEPKKPTVKMGKIPYDGMMKEKPKRARTKGRYRGDDKATPDVNEAWVGGKSPMSKKERNALDRAMKKATEFRGKK